MDFNNELWSSESYSQLVLILWILIYLMVCTFPILFLIAAAIASDRRLNSITNLPNFENEKKLILKCEMVRGELQFDHSLGLSSDAVSYLKHESEECDSETNPKKVISNDEHDSIQNQFNSPKSEQCFKENDMVRAELQCEDPLWFNTDSVSTHHFMNDFEWGNSEGNSNHVIRIPDETAVYSGNTKDRCPKPASLKYLDSDSSASISSWNSSPRVSWDCFADVSSDDVFVGIHEDGLYIDTDILEAENDHDMSLHQHKFEEEENKESSSGIKKDFPPISNSEDNSALKGSRRGNEVELKSRKEKQTNISPSMSHPQQPTVDAEDREYKNPGKFLMRKPMPKHPNYVPLLSRISSFAGWPTYLDQTPQIMAEAGFFYTGINDYTRCFHCGGGLRKWEPGDNPWIEHARWFPECAYVLDKKGQKFVNAVHSKVEQLAINNAWRSESSSMTNISRIRRRRTAINLEFDSSWESGSKSGQQETTIEQESLLPDEGRGSRPWRQSNSATSSATMDELIEMRRLFTVNEDNSPQPLPTGIPTTTTTTTTESNQSRLNISNPMKSTVNLTSPSFRNHGASQNTEAAKSPSSLPRLETATLPQLDEKSQRKEWLRDRNTCRICKDSDRELRVLPCGHLECCEVCLQALRFCPFCQAT